ncbi:serine/threonine protein kinase [Stigmatella hybrida]|uniref:serine/threonine protein kinase n=1 Tax=Stigmatella hybrida TaxID=394097 RepID=UPI001CDB08B0|nr:protein kinase [Stigmatella hybrida]
MSATGFGIPRGAILFEADGVQYEFLEDLGEVQSEVRLFVGRRRIAGRPKNKVLIKAVGLSGAPQMSRVMRARAKLDGQVRLAKYLDHPGIHRVHGLKKVEGTWYVIAEFPSGNSLSTLLNLVSECRHWYTPLFAMYIGARVADVLAYAHAAKDEQGRPLNIVHRAIDADHVFLDWDGAVRISDFGLALSTLPGRVPSTVRRLYGDGFYASPEVLLGKRAGAHMDLFSLGVLMLELATGKNLLYAPDEVTEEVKASLSPPQLRRVKRAIERAQLSGCSPLLEDAIWRVATYTEADVERLTASLSEGLRMTLRKLLHPVQGERYPTAAELVEDLRRWLGGLTFSPADAIAELNSVMDEAAKHLAGKELETLPSSRRPLDALTTA